jgi:hypothetical protein
MAKIPSLIANRVPVMRQFAQAALDDGEFFFYVRIPESLLPEERGSRYEDPLIEALSEARLGRVTGGGQQLGEGNSVLYCGIDVVVSDRAGGLALLCKVLCDHGAPVGTVIEEHLPHYREHSVKRIRKKEARPTK